jgi:hypothetical protein
MAGEGHSFPNARAAVVLDEVKLHKVVLPLRSRGDQPLVVEQPPAAIRVSHRRLGRITINAADFDPAVH